nr:hypothetical protein 17 [bacterium]
MDGKKIGKVINDTYETVYGTNKSKRDIFGGGNAGMVAIAQGLHHIAESISELAQAIKQGEGRE